MFTPKELVWLLILVVIVVLVVMLAGCSTAPKAPVTLTSPPLPFAPGLASKVRATEIGNVAPPPPQVLAISIDSAFSPTKPDGSLIYKTLNIYTRTNLTVPWIPAGVMPIDGGPHTILYTNAMPSPVGFVGVEFSP